MANNISVLDSASSAKVVKTTDNAGVHTPHHNVDSCALPTGASTLAEQQTQTTSLQLIDDTVATTGSAITTKGLAVSGTDGTNARVLKVNSSGELQVGVAAGSNAIGKLSANSGVTIGAVEIASSQSVGLAAGTNGIGKLTANSGVDIGDVDVTSLGGSLVAHDAADSGNPHKIGARATGSLSAQTPVIDGDRTDIFAGLDGVQIVRPHCNLEDIVTGNASNTDGTSTQCIAAQASGIKTYLTSIVLTNTSSSPIFVEIKDGTTVKLTIPVPANSGAIFNPSAPVPGTAATAWNFDPSAATTTVYCSMIGFKSRV